VLGRELAENLQKLRAGTWSQMKRAQIDYEPMPYGSVLIVDDVEANIYVASGLMSPYKLKLDSATSAYAAIEKVKGGAEYDVIFMDHMMPEMDGIEATEILRGMGYKRPIVALTANVVGGQSNAFLRHGFDDFVSKPINVQVLNTVLCRLVRDRRKLPPDQAAWLASEAPTLPPAAIQPAPAEVDPQLAEIFTRDANKALAALEAMIEKKGDLSPTDIRSFTVYVHGMKSALAGLGNASLSATAKRLERTGREGDPATVAAEIPAFVGSLRAFVESLANREGEGRAEAGDMGGLPERLAAIAEACRDFDGNAADAILSELKQKAWPKQTKDLLDTLGTMLLHSDFDSAADAASAGRAGPE
jgi:CheY-like chemotaxis protein